jgi:hypothetical protein
MYLSNGFPDLDLSMVSNGDDASRRITFVLLYSYVMKYDVDWNWNSFCTLQYTFKEADTKILFIIRDHAELNQYSPKNVCYCNFQRGILHSRVCKILRITNWKVSEIRFVWKLHWTCCSHYDLVCWMKEAVMHHLSKATHLYYMRHVVL